MLVNNMGIRGNIELYLMGFLVKIFYLSHAYSYTSTMRSEMHSDLPFLDYAKEVRYLKHE